MMTKSLLETQETEAKPDTPVVAVVVKGDVDGSVEVTLIVSLF